VVHGTIPFVSNIKYLPPFVALTKLGPRLRVVALIDPNPVQSQRVLEVKRQSFVELAYRDTQEFRTLEDYLEYAKVFLREGLI
jgi:hypothetical protein